MNRPTDSHVSASTIGNSQPERRSREFEEKHAIHMQSEPRADDPAASDKPIAVCIGIASGVRRRA